MKNFAIIVITLMIGATLGMIVRDATINHDEQLFRCQEELEITYKILENPHHCVSVCNEVYGVED